MGRFRGRLTALGLWAALAVSGCAPAAGTVSSISVDDSILTVARVKDAVTLDPAQATDSASIQITEEVMRGLVQFKVGTFEVEPAIAQSWQVSPDGRTWTFALKRGLEFSDGTPVDADA